MAFTNLRARYAPSASGALFQPITTRSALTIGEDRTLRFVVEDENAAAIASFSGWTFSWYLLPRLKTARTATEVILTKAVVTQTAPNVDVTIDPADTLTAVTAGTKFYELWRTNTDTVARLAYGPCVFID